EQSLRLARETGDTWNTAWCLASLGYFEQNEWTDPARGVERLEEALRLFRNLGDGWGTSHVLRRLVWFLTVLGDYDRATILAQEAVVLARQARNQHAIACTLSLLGNVLLRHAEDAESLRRRYKIGSTILR